MIQEYKKDFLISRNSNAVVLPLKENQLIVAINDKNFSIEGDEIKDLVIPILLLLGDGAEKLISEVVEQLLQSLDTDENKLHNTILQLINLGILEKKLDSDVSRVDKLLKQFNLSDEKIDGIKNKLNESRILIVCNTSMCDIISSCFIEFGFSSTRIITEQDFMTSLNEIDFEFLYYHSSVENVVILDKINNHCLKHKIPYLISKSLNFVVEIGPLVIPFKTSCLACQESRKLSAMNFPIEQEFINDYVRMNNLVFSKESVFTDISIEHSLVEIFKFLTKEYIWKYPKTMNSVIKMDLFSADYEYSRILKKPFCKYCSPLANEAVLERKTWTTKHNCQK